MIYRRCALCGFEHAITHSLLCAMCWGGLIGDVPGSPADETIETCDDGVDRG